jgi:hypothetical protein
VYLQLTKLLRIEDHPSLTRPIDPSLYIHRFVEKLEVPHATVRRGAQPSRRRSGQVLMWLLPPQCFSFRTRQGWCSALV